MSRRWRAAERQTDGFVQLTRGPRLPFRTTKTRLMCGHRADRSPRARHMSDNPFAKAAANDCKRFLREQDVEGVDDMSLGQMRVLCGQKKRRLLKQGGHRPLAQASAAALSLDAFIGKITTMQQENYGPKAFPTIKAYMSGIEGDIIVDRCSAPEALSGCKGIVLGGKCRKCERVTTGVKNFLMKLQLVDLQDSKIRYEMTGWKAAAKAIFGSDNATEVSKKPQKEIEDTLETWSLIPVQIKALVEYDMVSGNVRVIPFSIEKLSLDYVTDYASDA